MPYSDFEMPARPDTIQSFERYAGASKAVEQRQDRRAIWHAEVTVKELPSDSVFPTLVVSGEVINISRSGACIVSNVPFVPECVVHCDISLPGLEISLPTLMQVVWVEPADQDKYLWGLRYVV